MIGEGRIEGRERRHISLNAHLVKKKKGGRKGNEKGFERYGGEDVTSVLTVYLFTSANVDGNPRFIYQPPNHQQTPASVSPTEMSPSFSPHFPGLKTETTSIINPVSLQRSVCIVPLYCPALFA